MLFRRLSLCSFLLLTFNLFGQESSKDTLKLTLKQAENTFVSQNLSLLAQKYNIDANKALILQAKLYPNLQINLVQGAFNPETKKWFEQDFQNGEQAYQLSQLIVLSHKIKKQTKIAETNYQLAEDNFYDLLRTLKFALRSNFFNIFYLQQTSKVYDQEIAALQDVVNSYDKVKDKGYVSKSDVVLVKARLYSLKSEYQNLIDNINDLQSQTRLLLQVSSKTYIQPLVGPDIAKESPLQFTFKSLLDSAYQNRTDLIIAQDNVTLSQQNLDYQKALAVPDITLGAGFDRHGSYVSNFSEVSVGFAIPIFNRNQGNIKNSKILIDYYKTQLQQTRQNLDEQISRGLEKAVDADKLLTGIDSTFKDNFNALATEMLNNYLRRNVNIIQFLTLYDAYKQNVVQLNSILFNKVNALENLNFLTGTNFYNKQN